MCWILIRTLSRQAPSNAIPSTIPLQMRFATAKSAFKSLSWTVQYGSSQIRRSSHTWPQMSAFTGKEMFTLNLSTKSHDKINKNDKGRLHLTWSPLTINYLIEWTSIIVRFSKPLHFAILSTLVFSSANTTIILIPLSSLEIVARVHCILTLAIPLD